MSPEEWEALCPTIKQHWRLDARWWYRDVADLDGGLVTSALAELAVDGDLTVEPSPSLIRQIVTGMQPVPRIPDDPPSTGPTLSFTAYLEKGCPGLYDEDSDRAQVARDASRWSSRFAEAQA